MICADASSVKPVPLRLCIIPHICTLHDVGHQDGIDYFVMEYLQRETLADRLQKGALPLDQALKYAIEIADALAHAPMAAMTFTC